VALKMKDKSKVTRNHTRLVLTGMPSIGKSTAMGTIAKKAIVIDLNKRFPKDLVNKHDFPEMTENYAGVKEVLNSILAEPKLDHDFIILDTATDLLRIIKQHSITVDFQNNAHNYADYSKGDKTFAPNYMNEILSLFDRIGEKHGVNLGIICHTASKPQPNPLGKDYQKQCLDLPDRVAACVMQWADVVGYAYNDVVVQQDGLKMKARGQTRVITFNDSPAYEAKSGGAFVLPEKIAFDKEGKWADLVFGTRPLLNELEQLLDQYPEDKVEEVRAGLEKMNYKALSDAELGGLVGEMRKYVTNVLKKEKK
jgi:hypothetical protein